MVIEAVVVAAVGVGRLLGVEAAAAVGGRMGVLVGHGTSVLEIARRDPPRALNSEVSVVCRLVGVYSALLPWS